MKKISWFALTILVATCNATAPSIPELRLEEGRSLFDGGSNIEIPIGTPLTVT
jgi:hypothetical protein